MTGHSRSFSAGLLHAITLHTALALAVLTLLCTACGTLADGASYVGTRYPPLVTAEQVTESLSVPEGHEVIGRVNASCSDATGDIEWYDVLLSDIVCSQDHLASTMRSKVAEVGGTTLVGRSCDQSTNTETHTKKEDGKEREVTVTRTHIGCEGDVSRPKPPPEPAESIAASRRPEAAPKGEDSDADTPDTDESTAPWRIRVRVTPSKDTARRQPRDQDVVDAVEDQPEGTERIGDIVARCEQGCSKSAVTRGVREAGARLGAIAVVHLVCVEEGEGWTCTGTAVAPAKQ